MKKLVIGFLLLAATSLSFSQDEEFEFRNGMRPIFDKTINAKQLSALQAADEVVLIDVRLVEDFAADPTLIPGAEYMDPEKLPSWMAKIDKSKEVVVYCVGGKWVSQKVAHLLEQSGVVVQSLEGGMEAWKLTQDIKTSQ